MEILVNRVYWEERKDSKDQIKPKWIFEEHIMSIEVAMRDESQTEVQLANGETIVIDEPMQEFKKRVDNFIKQREADEEEARRREDLGY